MALPALQRALAQQNLCTGAILARTSGDSLRHQRHDSVALQSRHKNLTQRTDMAVYFCDPHSPWQRGTCENTNGLLRQYLPKGTDLSSFNQDDLDSIADSLNYRPPARHAFHTPLEVFARMLALTHQPSPAIY